MARMVSAAGIEQHTDPVPGVRMMTSAAELTAQFRDESSLPLVWISTDGSPYNANSPLREEPLCDPELGMVDRNGEPVISWIGGVGSATLPTNYAEVVRREHPQARVYAIRSDRSPRAASLYPFCEHRFAVVDERWLVDLALWHLNAGVVGDPKLGELRLGDQFVFDLEAPADQERVMQLYGDRPGWVEVANA